MPSYFFHIAFELHTPSLAPLPQTDIFDSELAAHNTSPWASLTPAHPSYKQALTFPSSASAIGQSSSSNPNSNDRPLLPRRLSHRTWPSFSEARSSPVPAARPAKSAHHASDSLVPQDWRFDSICIQSIDMALGTSNGNGPPHAKSKQHSHSGGLTTKGAFIPSNVKDTDVGWGVVHLYRDGHETPGLYDDVLGTDGEFKEEECTTLCILAVPSYMTPSDFLGYVGEQTREDVSHFRLIKTARANKYMVLMKFREAKNARDWRKAWNGKAFNSMEPEYCHVVFVKSITFQTSDTSRDPSSYPHLTNDPFTPTASASTGSTKQPSAPLPSSASDPSPLSTKPFAPPTPSLVELPTCPVCLERMDESTGLLTILCQHVFHCACLEKWRGGGCPVCRYTQNDAFSYLRSDGDAPESECSVCGTVDNLWICLICGNIGCGRYDSAHAYAHYEATNHSYAMDIVSQHVWDYAGDGYVHRLIQNKADGKLVDLPASTQKGKDANANASMTGYAADSVPREKVDNMGMEYAYLLTSQLESQRLYFEEQVERAVDKAAKAAASAEDAQRTVAALTTQLFDLKTSYEDTKTQLVLLEKEAARKSTRAAAAQELARKMTAQFREEQTVNESLLTRIAFLEKKAKEAEERVREVEKQKMDLEEQNRDLSFFISAQEKLKEMEANEGLGLDEEEIQGASVEVVEKKKPGRRKGKGKK